MKNIPKEDWVITQTHLFFWNSLYSQWYLCDFVDENWQKYSSAEKYMMIKKAELFENFDIAEQMRQIDSPKQLKQLWRLIKNFDEKIWGKYRFEIVKKWNYFKFSQNSDLLKYLKMHKNLILVEWSPCDIIWWVGIHYKDEKIKDKKNWKWLNLLGKAIMEVRKELLRGFENT